VRVMRAWSSGKVVSSSARVMSGRESTRTQKNFAVLERDWIWYGRLDRVSEVSSVELKVMMDRLTVSYHLSNESSISLHVSCLFHLHRQRLCRGFWNSCSGT
jgi:hypothetical protein